MAAILEHLALQFASTPANLMLVGIGAGTLVGFFGLLGLFSDTDPTARRMRAIAARVEDRDRTRLMHDGADPMGLMKALMPAKRDERTRIRRQLAQAGFDSAYAVRNFFLLRAFLGLLLPGMVVGAMLAGSIMPLPGALGAWLGGLGRLQSFQILSLLVAVGFFGPSYWLRSRAAARRRAIEEGFPNALDLMQISVEAGLGFDAAMTRVASELCDVAPPIAEEFMLAQKEISAGRSRERALDDMAERMGVDEVSSFAKVVLQSMQFGTSISDALLTYASEMRQNRELRAQEKANKLPVQMSAVLALLMLPALIMIALAPTVIRYVRYFAGG